ncbi:helix-turn-helix domain-containing protein [Acrocarpospora catenulata]|uniref:helix-turn-helix domain-containing protein n=1 Tax=Acrocarpospora catenulata TaxID=2836182 RepID=UPI003556DC75
MRHYRLRFLSVGLGKLLAMSRYRLSPTPAQEAALSEHCGHARFVWIWPLNSTLSGSRAVNPLPGSPNSAGS